MNLYIDVLKKYAEPQRPRQARPGPYRSIQRQNHNRQQPTEGVDSAEPEFRTRLANSTLQYQLGTSKNLIFLETATITSNQLFTVLNFVKSGVFLGAQLYALGNRVFLQAQCAIGRRKSIYADSGVDNFVGIYLAVCVRYVSRYALLSLSKVAA